MESNLQKDHTPDDSKQQLSQLITVVCLIIFTALVYYWLVTNKDASPEGRFAALLNASLFAVLGIRFIPMWVASWSNKLSGGGEALADEGTPADIDKKSTYVKIFVSILFFDIFIILFIYFLQIISEKGGPFREALRLWESTDSGHYLDIAKDWYLSTGHKDRLVQLVFLPGYPLLIRFMNIFVGNYLYSGMIVSGLCFAGAGTMLYRLARLDHNREYAVRVLKFLCIFPGSFFFAAPMSESLFLLLSVFCIYFLRKKDWFIACILAGWAAFTRSLGLVLIAPVLFEMIAEDRRVGEGKQSSVKSNFGRQLLFKYSNIIFILLGFSTYLFVNYQVSGNPFQFLIYQKEHWSQSLGLFFNTASYQTDNAIRTFHKQEFHSLLGLWVPNLLSIFSCLVIMVIAVKKIRPAYTAYFIAYYIVAIGATWLLSAPRYLLTLFPIHLGLASMAEKRWVDRLLMIVCIIASIVYAYMFVNRWQVW
jgi:Gpi18-like mannosyltransferase